MGPRSGSGAGTVFLSPHYDDVAFSCGALVAQLRRTERVWVVNLFTRYGAADDAGTTSTRLAEERRAARCLGYETLSLELPDAPLRRSRYASAAALFHRPDPEDLDALGPMAEALAAALQDIPYHCVYAPLAVGWHVDHVLCHLAARSGTLRAPLYFYEDAPYCFMPGFTGARLAEVAGDPGAASRSGRKGSDVDAVASFRQAWRTLARTAIVRQHRRAARPIVNAVVSSYLARLPRHHLLAPPLRGYAPLRLRERLHDVTDHLEDKLAACSQYATQVTEFYPDREQMRRFYQEHSASLRDDGRYYERYWVPLEQEEGPARESRPGQ